MPDEVPFQEAVSRLYGGKTEAPPLAPSGEVSFQEAVSKLYGRAPAKPVEAPKEEGPGVLKRALTAADTALEEMHPLDYIAGQAEKAVGKVVTFDRAKLGLKPSPKEYPGKGTPEPFMPEKMGEFYGPGASFLDWPMEPTERAKSTMDYFKRVLPYSAGKTALGLGRFFSYDLPRPFVNAVFDYAATKTAEGVSAGDVYKFMQIMNNPILLTTELGRIGKPGDAYGKLLRDIGEGVWMHTQGLASFMGEPNPLLMTGGYEKFKERWATDPFGSMLAITPFITRGWQKYSEPKPLNQEAWKRDIGLLEKQELDLGRQELTKPIDEPPPPPPPPGGPGGPDIYAPQEGPIKGFPPRPPILPSEVEAKRKELTRPLAEEVGAAPVRHADIVAPQNVTPERMRLIQEVVEDTKARMVPLETVGKAEEQVLPVMEEPSNVISLGEAREKKIGKEAKALGIGKGNVDQMLVDFVDAQGGPKNPDEAALYESAKRKLGEAPPSEAAPVPIVVQQLNKEAKLTPFGEKSKRNAEKWVTSHKDLLTERLKAGETPEEIARSLQVGEGHLTDRNYMDRADFVEEVKSLKIEPKPKKEPTEGLVDQGEGILTREKKGAWGTKRAANVAARAAGKEFESVETEGKWGIRKEVEEPKEFEVPAETKRITESIREAESKELDELYEKKDATKIKLDALQRSNKIRRGTDPALIEQAAELDLEQDRTISRILMLEKATGRKRIEVVGETSLKEIKRKVEEKETPELDPRNLTLEEANARRELFKDRPDDNPDMAIARRVADVNAWREGAEDVNIEEVRGELDWIAENIDRLEKDYSQQEFAGIRAHAKESAAWARQQRRKGAGETQGTILRMGFDPTMLKGLAKSWHDMCERSSDLAKGTFMGKLRWAKKGTYRALVDSGGLLKTGLFDFLVKVGNPEMARRIWAEMILMRGGPEAANVWVAQAMKNTYDGIPHWKQEVLDRVISARRTIDIDSPLNPRRKNIKHPAGLGRDAAEAYIQAIKDQLSSKDFADIENRAKTFFDKMRELVDELYEAELITKRQRDSLVKHEYSPREAVEVIDPIVRRNRFSTKADVHESGVKVLREGTIEDVLKTDQRILMKDFAARTKGRIARNNGTRALKDVAKDHPDNPFVRLVENVRKEDAPKWEEETYFEKGKKQTLLINKDFAKEWVLRDSAISYEGAQWARAVSLSVITRPLAVGINPTFAGVQLLLDAFQIWSSSQVFVDGKWRSTYNPVTMPFSYGKDLSAVFGDAWNFGPKFRDFINNGGGMGWMTGEQSMIFGPKLGKSKWARPQEILDPLYLILGKLPRVTELMARLAVTEQALSVIAKREKLKGGKEEARTFVDERGERVWMREAVAVARDYIDFNQGGHIVKAADTGFLFLNAGFQAGRGILRAAGRNKPEAALKLGLLAAPAIALTIANLTNAPNLMNSLSTEDKVNNIILTPFGDYFFLDQQNQKRYVGISIPKNPSLRIFSTMFELATEKAYKVAMDLPDKEVDTDGLFAALADFSPVTGTTWPPAAAGLLGFLGWDTYKMKPVWSGSDVPKEMQYREGDTPEAMIALGKLTKQSPENWNTAFRAVFTRSDYSTIGGALIEQAFSEAPKNLKDQHIALILDQTPIIKRFIVVTRPGGRWGKELGEASQDVRGEKFRNNSLLDHYLNGYLNEKTVEREKIVDFFSNIKDPNERKRLHEREKFYKKVNDFEEKDLILKFHFMDPDARARFYVNDFEKRASKAEMATFRMESRRLSKDIFNQEFWSEVAKIRRENERQSSSSSKQ